MKTKVFIWDMDIIGDNLAKALIKRGIKAKYYPLDYNVYLTGYGRDIIAYYKVLPEATGQIWNKYKPLEGTRLNVFSTCKQSRNWIVNRCKQVKHKIMLKCQEVGIPGCDQVCDNWEDVIL